MNGTGMVKTLKHHRTIFFFWTNVILALLAAALVYRKGISWLPLLLLVIAFNVWSLIISEKKGFVRSRQARRAFEPPRNFNMFQTLLIFILLILQISVAVLVLLNATLPF